MWPSWRRRLAGFVRFAGDVLRLIRATISWNINLNGIVKLSTMATKKYPAIANLAT